MPDAPLSPDEQPTAPLPPELAGSAGSSESADPTEPIDPFESGHPTIPLAAAASAPPPITRPRIRWAGVVWGALFAAFGITVMSVLATTGSRRGFDDWVNGLGAYGDTIVAVAAVGALLLVLGVIAAANRVSRPR